MYPIMSDMEISVRTLERTMEHEAFRHRLMVARLARERGLPGMGTRLVHAVWQFIDPRGYALAQYRRSVQAGQVTEANVEPVVASTPALMHAFPIASSDDRETWSRAA